MMMEERVDLRRMDAGSAAEGKKTTELLFRLHQTMPMTEEYQEILQQLFRGQIGEGSYVSVPISTIACAERIHIGKHCFINGGCVLMGRGGITIEDNVQIAANVQLISNNHDPYQRLILTCRPVHIKEGAWIGAGASILPGVCVGKYAIVGAGTVVTKDVPDYAVVVGNPARLVKMLSPEGFLPEDPGADRRYRVLKIEEDLDFGCEERPEESPVMAVVTLLDEQGEESRIRHEDQLLYALGIQEGDTVILDQEGVLEKL